MRLVVNRLLAVRRGGLGQSGAEHHGPGEGAEAAGDVDGTGSGEIVEAELVEPSAGVPLPVREADIEVSGSLRRCTTESLHVVDECGPAEQEHHAGEETTTLEHGSSQNHSGSGNEGEAKGSICTSQRSVHTSGPHDDVHRISGTSELAMDGCARTLWNAASDRSPQMGFVVLDWYSEYP